MKVSLSAIKKIELIRYATVVKIHAIERAIIAPAICLLRDKWEGSEN